MSLRFQSERNELNFNGWNALATTDHILKSDGPERHEFESQLLLPHLPEMVFAENVLRLTFSNGNGVEFNSLDALKQVDAEHESVQVATAQAWRQARSECEFIGKVIHPFDWTFTSDYTGSLIGDVLVESTDERIDTEKLRGKEKIHFYADVQLYEDELHDCGCSQLGVKIRMMPSYFFILMRFYLRVDDVLVRVNETRFYHEFGTNYVLREFVKRQSKVDSLKVPMNVITDPNAVVDFLPILFQKTERLKMADQ